LVGILRDICEELDAQSQLDSLTRRKSIVLDKETDEFKVQAIALAILGMEAFWSSLKCKAKLKRLL
jgi:hypothetical protein